MKSRVCLIFRSVVFFPLTFHCVCEPCEFKGLLCCSFMFAHSAAATCLGSLNPLWCVCFLTPGASHMVSIAELLCYIRYLLLIIISIRLNSSRAAVWVTWSQELSVKVSRRKCLLFTNEAAVLFHGGFWYLSRNKQVCLLNDGEKADLLGMVEIIGSMDSVFRSYTSFCLSELYLVTPGWTLIWPAKANSCR